MDIDLQKAKNEFSKNKIMYKEGQSLEFIARANGKNAMQLYVLIKKFEPKMEVPKNSVFTAAEVEAKFAGKGYGKKVCTKSDESREAEFVRGNSS